MPGHVGVRAAHQYINRQHSCMLCMDLLSLLLSISAGVMPLHQSALASVSGLCLSYDTQDAEQSKSTSGLCLSCDSGINMLTLPQHCRRMHIDVDLQAACCLAMWPVLCIKTAHCNDRRPTSMPSALSLHVCFAHSADQAAADGHADCLQQKARQQL